MSFLHVSLNCPQGNVLPDRELEPDCLAKAPCQPASPGRAVNPEVQIHRPLTTNPRGEYNLEG